MGGQTIVILGAGIGGVVAANRLRRQLDRRHRIVLVDREPSFALAASPSERFDGHGACFVETGDGRAGFGAGDFYAEPTPAIRMRRPRWYWHAGKVLFEKQVLWGWL